MKHSFAYLFIILIFLVAGCASQNYQYSSSRSDHYTSAYPTQNVSRQLIHIQQSIRRITTTALYRTYFIDQQNVTLQELIKGNLKDKGYRTAIIDRHKAGTGVAILVNRHYTAMLSAQHVVFYPDTLVIFKKGENIPEKKYVKSIGIKTKQRNYVVHHATVQKLNVIAREPNTDLGLLILSHPDQAQPSLPPLDLKLGDPKKLQPGSFLYVLGYPFGSPMVTRGIVSAPNYDEHGAFLTDALFNHGISGGLIIASNDHFASFQWMGMAVTASASTRLFLVPKTLKNQQYRNHEAYHGTPYILRKQLINYGITSATPVTAIKLFLLKNEAKLNHYGLSMTDL